MEEEVEGRALLHGLHLRGEVGEDAGLRGDLVARRMWSMRWRSVVTGGDVVGDGVDADDGVAGAEEEAVEDGGGDAGGVVGGVVGLQAGGEAAGKAYGGAEACDDGDLAGDEDEVLQAHELGDGGGHLGREAGGERGEAVGGGVVGEQPVAELADGEAGDGSEGCGGGFVAAVSRMRRVTSSVS